MAKQLAHRQDGGHLACMEIAEHSCCAILTWKQIHWHVPTLRVGGLSCSRPVKEVLEERQARPLDMNHVPHVWRERA